MDVKVWFRIIYIEIRFNLKKYMILKYLLNKKTYVIVAFWKNL